MNNYPFSKTRVGIYNDHFDQLGGGTTHSFKLIGFLKDYYDVDVYLPKNGKGDLWFKKMLNLDTSGITILPYSKGIGDLYDYMFLNISHWRAEPTNALKKFMLVFFPQFFFPTYDYHFIANSNYTKENIINLWKKNEEEITVIYPPIQTSQFKKDIKENIILHVSRLSKPRPEADKGHWQMVQAFKQLSPPNWQLHFVGEPQDLDYVHKLRIEAFESNIIFHENLAFDELKNLYGKAKIYWHMTGIGMPDKVGAQEHFGMTIVEAMSAGCVPISYNSGGPKEIIKDGFNGHLVNDVEELKHVTQNLIDNEKTWKALSENAIEDARRFDEKEIKKQFYSLISKTDKVSIIIICHNNIEYTKKCVERLFQVTPPGFHVILVDNASTDNTSQEFRKLQDKYKNIKIIGNDKNLGFAEANNRAVQELEDMGISTPYICFLNNDTLPQWGWLEKMIDVLEKNDKAGIVGARLYFPQKKDGSWHLQHAGVEFMDDMTPKHVGRTKNEIAVPLRGVQEVEAITGACMLVRKELSEFNEEFERGYYEDTDLCLRAREAGYRIYINHESKLIHYEGTTQNILKKSNADLFSKTSKDNLDKFKKIWKKKINNLKKIEKYTPLVSKGKTIDGIEIGGGENPIHPEYKQVDLRKVGNVQYVNDARMLPFPDNCVKNISSCYLLQCFNRQGAEDALREWFRVLAPGGKLEVIVPDIKRSTMNLFSSNDEKWLSEIYGSQKHELDYYKTAWTFETLDHLISGANFVRLSKGKIPKQRPQSISVIAHKPKDS